MENTQSPPERGELIGKYPWGKTPGRGQTMQLLRNPPLAPAHGELDEDTLRDRPFIVPWTWGEYHAVRYLAGSMRGSLADIGRLAMQRGLQVLARETMAAHMARGKPVPQRLAVMARGEVT